jgi:hypothetical protein
MDLLKPSYNILKKAGVYFGHKQSDEVKKKLSERMKGRGAK